jgi:deferrochelatase/peroxidase EfeB
MSATVELEQVQGLVRFGYRRLTECSFLLLKIRDAQAAREWLASAPVSSAVTLDAAPSTALQVAFTSEGLLRLGLEPELLAQCSLEFQSGIAGSHARSRLLGDVGASTPEHWIWGAEPSSLHVLVMLYAQPGKLAAWRTELQTQRWAAAFDIAHELLTSDLDGAEPFGFPDGLSQPALDWERRRIPPETQDEYTNEIALGEVLLGYPNEYNRYTDRPLLPATFMHADLLPIAEDQAGLRDFGRNGCYLVLRTLQQDVTGFASYVSERAGMEPGGPVRLASAMVGRHRDGAPLAMLSTNTIAGVAADDPYNHFTFDADPDGTQCPLGAHIRRANPRNGDLPAPRVSGLRRVLTLVGIGPKTLHTDAKASSRFHRILRRGREYGTPPSTGEPASTEGRGIHFVCLVANLARQFEFLQSAWMMSTKFDGMTDESDPLLGNREPIPGAGPADVFSRPDVNGPSCKFSELPQFVSVRGGAYFFLPSLPAIRYLAASRETQA